MLDPLTLGEPAEALEARARVSYLTLHIEPGDAFHAWLEPRLDPATGKAYELPYRELLIDPYTGEKLGARTWGEVSLAKENLLSFLYTLAHEPRPTREPGQSRRICPRDHGPRLDARLFRRVLSDLASGAEKTPPDPPFARGREIDTSLRLTKGEI